MIIKGNNMNENYEKAAEIIVNSKQMIALTGAGISVESGIPDFRSPGGLWEKFDPIEFAHIDSFRKNPKKIWKLFFSMLDIINKAKFNPAHAALAKLEEMGKLKAIITQNIDNLHQEAGSSRVVEYHGNMSRLECLNCNSSYKGDEFTLKGTPPECKKCGKILKPSAIFFGEMIPQDALIESQELAESADAVIVVGTSAVVYPASSIPHTAKKRGAKIIEMNIEKTGLTTLITDVFIEGKAGKTLPELLKYMN